MSAKRILVVTSSHLCRNPRVMKAATTLGSAGYVVTVLSVSTTDRFERMDLEMVSSLPFHRVVLDCRRSVDRWRNLRVRSLTWIGRGLVRRFGMETASALGPARPLLARARACPADLTLLHNEIPLWCATRLANRGRRIAVDFEDWYSEDLLERDRRHRPLRLLRRAEKFALQHSAFVTATSESMADALAAAYATPRPLVVRNVFPLPPRSRLDRPAQSGPPALVWFSQTLGPGRGLEPFLAAWARTRCPSRVVLIGEPTIGYSGSLLAAVEPARRTDVSFHPLVPPAELPDKLAEFDIGLALEPASPRNRDLTITNKIFQYLNAGLAIVATKTDGQREVMSDASGSGVMVDLHNSARLTADLDALLSDRARLSACQRAARTAAETEFCWEKESPRLLGAVERALAAN